MSKQTPIQQVAAPVAPITQLEQPFSLSETIKSAKTQWSSIKQQLKESDAYKAYDDGRKTMCQEVCKPLSAVWKNTYTELPLQTTKLKFSYLEDFAFKERFLLLNILAVGGALLTLRRINAGNFLGKTFASARNATLSYIIGGLFIAPEIYNPLMSE